ncbi:MAG: hypothetical protein ACK50A_05800 [Sphingobacteriaceae bacterium]|jgi:high-affinity nickel-transport protein
MGYELSSITLMLVLGLRHGLDPDHIAVIDNLTMHHHGIKSSFGKWSGSLFAIGHGIVITIVSVIFSFVENSVFTNCGLLSVLEWVPILLLYLVGFINLKSLLSKTSDYKVQGWRFRFIPKKLLGSKSALSIVLSGVLFALVFDTVTQAAAWGYTASLQGGIAVAIVMGLIFSVGMIATDTIDGRILYSILNKADNKADNKSTIVSYRKWIGWCIVTMTFFIAFYKTLNTLYPEVKLSETIYTMIGALFFLSVLIIYAYAAIKIKYAKPI